MLPDATCCIYPEHDTGTMHVYGTAMAGGHPGWESIDVICVCAAVTYLDGHGEAKNECS